MSLNELFEQIHLDTSKLEAIRKRLSEDPTDKKMLLAERAIRKRLFQAQNRLVENASANQIDILRYRVQNLSERYTVSSVAESLTAFQKGFTALHDALVNGPKNRGRYSAEVISETSFHIGYTYPGSFGFALSLANPRNLFDGQFDRSVEALSDFVRISSIDDASSSVRVLGLAATSNLFGWIDSNAKNMNEIDLQWRKSSGDHKGEVVTYETFLTLREVFEQASDLEEEFLELPGLLVGIDMKRRNFHFVGPSDTDYRGEISPDVASGEYTVPRPYIAKLRVETTLRPATGEKREKYFLLHLEDQE